MFGNSFLASADTFRVTTEDYLVNVTRKGERLTNLAFFSSASSLIVGNQTGSSSRNVEPRREERKLICVIMGFRCFTETIAKCGVV